MRKVNARQFLEQSKHAAEWQRKTLDAARAAGHDVFQDCVIDYAAVEQRVSRGDHDLAERHQHASDAHAKATSGEYADQLTAQYACSRCIQPAATGLNKA